MLLACSPSFFSRIWISSAMAWHCLELEPLQMMKKSAKELMSRRSRTRISLACFASAAFTASFHIGSGCFSSGASSFFARGRFFESPAGIVLQRVVLERVVIKRGVAGRVQSCNYVFASSPADRGTDSSAHPGTGRANRPRLPRRAHLPRRYSQGCVYFSCGSGALDEHSGSPGICRDLQLRARPNQLRRGEAHQGPRRFGGGPPRHRGGGYRR